MEEVNVTSATDSILTTVLLNDLAKISTSIMFNDTSPGTYVELPEENGSNQRLWNFTKATTIPSAESTLISLNVSRSTTVYTSTTTLDTYDEFGPPEGIEYIFVPLGVVVFVIILSAVVLIVSRKRKLERLRHRLMPMYNFDPGEEEEDDWETELLDECYNNHQRRQGYQSMDTDENTELFGGH